jgi:TRAP-type C4-dicarboxylate transport system permease small subunit
MKVEKSSYLKIRLDWLYSIYLIFVVAILVRYLWILSHLLRGEEPEEADPTQASSGL